MFWLARAKTGEPGRSSIILRLTSLAWAQARPPAGAPPELLFKRCAFLLQRSLGFFQFFLTSNETCPPLTHLLPVPSSRRRGRG